MKHKRNLGMTVVALLAMAQSALRLYFGLGTIGVLGSDMEAQLTTLLENPVTDPLLPLAIPFFLLGAFGIVTAIGLLAGRSWGVYGTIALSAVTIIYDAWAMAAVQCTAVMGMVLPAIFIIYLMIASYRSKQAKGAAT